MAPTLARAGFRVLCPDMPSFGLTEDLGDCYAPGRAGHVDFLHDFTEALALSRFHLAGNSMGASTAAHYACAHPDRVQSLIMIAGHLGDIVSQDEYEAAVASSGWAKPKSVPFDGSASSMLAMLRLITLKPEDLTEDLVEMRTRAANRNHDKWARHHHATFHPGPNETVRLRTKGRLDQLDIPGIYLFGKQDNFLPVVLGYLQEDALPNFQFFYPEDTGHQGQTDRPELFARVFIEFLRDGRVSRRTADDAGVSQRRPELPALVEQGSEHTATPSEGVTSTSI